MASVTPNRDTDETGTSLEGASYKLLEMDQKWKRLKTLNNDLQEALEKSDVEVQELTQEMASLREENKRLQKEKTKFLDLMEEADKLKLSLEHCKNAEYMAQHGKKELERRCLLMEEKTDQLLHQISISEEQNGLLRDDITKLKQQVLELERYLDAKTLELKEKDNHAQERESVIEEMTLTMNQYISIKEGLNNKIQDLLSQLEESYQEIAMRKALEENESINNPGANGTIMYEIIQTRMEKQLVKAHMEKQYQGVRGFLGLRLLLSMALQFLWCSCSVGIFLLLFLLVMHLYHTLYPDYLVLDLHRAFSTQTVEVIQNILRPYLKLRGLGVVPS